MQIVIDIPKKWFDDMVREDFIDVDELCAIIQHSPVLPEHHGRLIDADALKEDAQTMTEWNGDVFRCVTERTIDYAPTILEADKEQKE